MARRRSLLVSLGRVARAAARAQREAEADARRRARDELRNQREAIRLRQVHERLRRQNQQVSRQEEAQALTSEIADQVNNLRTSLAARENPTREQIFTSLRVQDPAPVLRIPAVLQQGAAEPVRDAFTSRVLPPTWLERLVRSNRYESEIGRAGQQFRVEHTKWQEAESARLMGIASLERAHQDDSRAYQSRVALRDQEVNDLRQRFETAEVDAVVTFFEVVLNRSVWPDDFPQEYRVAYEPAAKQLVVEYELPTAGIVPTVAEYKYVKVRDAVEEKARKLAEIKEIYRDLVAAIALRCIHECFSADGANHVDVLTFSGFVHTIDPATGNLIRPYLISVRVTKERFSTITLDRVDTKACLRNLGGQVSPQPAELIPVKPLIEFDMVDKRFVAEKDVLSELDKRPNLMDLTPSEFEALVGNLFTRMGLETKLTRTSRDGGVDAVAFDTRPILGGKVVIQAKRYSHTVGVSAVRDLYGTMMNEGANKGILVTTSSYGPDAYDFCKDKPVELIDGSGLLYHLEQLGVLARIIFPADQASIG
jgi:restriction system protein